MMQGYYTKSKETFFFLLKKAKKEYYQNLDLCNVNNSKKFWKMVEPVFKKQSQHLQHHLFN